MEKLVDLRSDTKTRPSEAMLKAMYKAEVGDEANREDPTVIKLQEMAADMLGKEDALFVTSGTMGNLVSLLAQTHPGDSMILESEAHIYRCETGHISAVGGVLPKRIPGKLGVLSPEDIEGALFGKGRLYPTTTMICLENTHNAAGGTCISCQQMAEIREVADRHNLLIHVDGARIFNAAIALNTTPKDLVREADSIQFCLTKGLSAPFGSLVVGGKEFIEVARKKRQMVGGDMRQAGVVAAAGIVALNSMIDRLKEDHQNAKVLAEGLRELGMEIDMETVQTNMVYFVIPQDMIDPQELVEGMKGERVLIGDPKCDRVRLVTHYGITELDIANVLSAFEKVLEITSSKGSRDKDVPGSESRSTSS